MHRGVLGKAGATCNPEQFPLASTRAVFLLCLSELFSRIVNGALFTHTAGCFPGANRAHFPPPAAVNSL